MKKILIVLVAAVAALVADAAPQKKPAPQRKPQPQRTTTVKRTPAPGARSVSRGHVRDRDRDRYDRLSHHDRRLIDAIEDADSLHELRRYLQAAAMSHSEEVRMTMVDALESEDMHGRSASDLAYFIADPNERVSAAAFSAWSSVLEDVHGARRARAILETADILRGFSGGLWQTPGAPLPAPAAVPMVQPVVTQPVVTQPVAQPVAVPAAY
ncbi:MAG: hypothetical protein J6V72_14325 [Kiritimatiellae bacterium]|nr:hypothetical protein [Kiritimatiellia bacterium]